MSRTDVTLLRRLAWLATVFALGVIVFGAFVRLSNAGLSCPDWPTCYGAATWPGHEHEIAAANEAFPQRPVESHKAWREQVHRMLAGTLGVLVLALAVLAVRRRPRLLVEVGVAAIVAAFGVFAYIRGAHALSGVLSAIAIVLPLLAAARIEGRDPRRIAVIVLAVIIFQAMLGMWTVTLLLKPIVVMAHLLGGLATFGLLAWVALSLSRGRAVAPPAAPRLRHVVAFGVVLLGCQIALGGWTSANYAALACGTDFPHCLGQWWPAVDFREGFVLWRGIGVNYEGGILDAAARSAIQIAHRIGALIVFLYLLATALATWRRGLHGYAGALVVLLLAQVSLGIGNVLLGLPLALATAHNGVAALLLFALLALWVRARPQLAASVTRGAS